MSKTANSLQMTRYSPYVQRNNGCAVHGVHRVTVSFKLYSIKYKIKGSVHALMKKGEAGRGGHSFAEL